MTKTKYIADQSLHDAVWEVWQVKPRKILCCASNERTAKQIAKALCIADRLERGEVSEEMNNKGIKTWMGSKFAIETIFKKMSQQLIQECENDR